MLCRKMIIQFLKRSTYTHERRVNIKRTLKERWAKAERPMWTNGERKLNGIGWVGVNGEHMQNAKVAQTGTQGEPWMHDKH